MYLVLALTILATLAEGIGIVMLLPLLKAIDGFDSGETTGVGAALQNILDRIGIADSLLGLLLLIAGFFLLKGAFMFLAQGYKAYLRGQLMRELKGRMYDDYSRMSYQYYASRDTGYFTNLINAQVQHFLTAFTSIIQFSAKTLMAIVYIGVALVVAWRFGVMALVVGGLIMAAFGVLNVYVRDLSRRSAAEASVLSKLMIQSLQSFKYLVATAQGDKPRKQTLKSIHRLTGYEIRSGIAKAFTSSVREPLIVVAILAVVIVQLLWFNQPLAAILVSIVLFKRGLDAILQMQTTLQATLSKIGSVEKVQEEFERQRQVREPEGGIEIGPLEEGVRFESVSFRYGADQDTVLKDISLEIAHLQSVALVGESGAGKSTLVDMLTLMLKPVAGRILIDDVPADQIRLSSWRRQIGYVAQETVVFNDTIANNICMWAGDTSSDEVLMGRVREAARQAHIAHFIESLPDGFDTEVGDRGMRLSGGQRQRLFIARELFKRPRLLILDEATSALDTESEQEIQKSIDELRGKMTVVIIAHRLSTVRNVDRIYVLDQGRIVEQGDYELLRNDESTRFAQLVAMQEL
ncbi:MAG: ATP-binding cassette domain-containing protein [Wenzhouxiangella sp.]|nr:MAG: ATP-binding cassette domain-containing protein [Wenzhouxiangella sp.]